MPPEDKDPAPREDELAAWSRVVKFTRQLSHDVRNGLNGLDLEAAFITELNTDPEIAGELKRLRSMVVTMTKHLHEVSSYMGNFSMNPIELETALLLGELRERLTNLYPDDMAKVAWSETPGAGSVELDVDRFTEALREIFKNAFQFHEKAQEIAFDARCEGPLLVLELREAKSAPLTTEGWGAPFFTTRRGNYGLGLFHARRVLAAHKGELRAAYDPTASALITRASLPLKT